MFIDSSWIDQELYAKVSPYLNLGSGYSVVFAQRTAIPVMSFTMHSTLQYGGGLNIIEQFVLKLAATLHPTIPQFAQITTLDEDIAKSVVDKMVVRNVVQLDEEQTMVLTDDGREIYHRLQTEQSVSQQIAGYRDVLTNDIALVSSADTLGSLVSGSSGNYLIEGIADQKKHSEFPSVEKLQEVFQKLTPADPYYGYRLLTTEFVGNSLVRRERPLGLLLIYDIVTKRLSVKVFDILKNHFNPALEQYYDPDHVAQKAGLVIEEEQTSRKPDADEVKVSEYIQDYIEALEKTRKSSKTDEETASPFELLVDFQIKPRFLELVQTAKQEIFLLSPWVNNFAMEPLIEPFTEAVKRGVRVIIAWGIDSAITHEIREENRKWVNRFKHAKLPNGLPGISFVWAGNHHRKEIIVDREQYTIGSFNWLSYRGEETKNMKLRGESVLLIHDSQIANEARNYFVKLISPALKRDWKYYLANLDAQQERNICISVWTYLELYNEALKAIKMLAGDSGKRHVEIAKDSLLLMNKVMQLDADNGDAKALARAHKRMFDLAEDLGCLDELEPSQVNSVKISRDVYCDNEFRDIYLDDAGVKRLRSIIKISKQDRDRALNAIDDLIRDYPQSPQLRISKSLFMLTPLDISPKLQVLREAIELDPCFYDGYRRMSQVMLGTAFRLNNAPAHERTTLDAILFGMMAMVNQYPENERDHVIIECLMDNDGLFEDNWNDIYAEAVGVLDSGFQQIGQRQYPAEMVGQWEMELKNYKTAVTEMKKYLIFKNYLQWTD